MVFVGLAPAPAVVATEEEAQLIADRCGTPWFFSDESIQECRLAAVELLRPADVVEPGRSR